MAVTIQNLINDLNRYIGDSSNDRITENDRFQYITEGVVWVQERLGNDLQNSTYQLEYIDGVNYYKITNSIADLLQGADLRRSKEDHDQSFAHKSARELAEEIGQGAGESSWSIERRDGDTFLVVNHGSKFTSKIISNFDSLNDGGGVWTVDNINSDGLNLTLDLNEKKEGIGSLNFDIDVSQSANDRASLINTNLDVGDLSEFEDTGSFIFWLYLPSVTNFSSVTLYWGSDSSNYWSSSVTTDINGGAFSVGWNRIKVDWSSSTKTLTPDISSISYVKVDINYTSAQADDTDYRIDNMIIGKPENLTFHYLSWSVGKDSSGNDINSFSATTDVPYFSDSYDQLKFPVSHIAASLAFADLRLGENSQMHERKATLSLRDVSKYIPSSRTPELKSFKVRGVRFNKRRI